MSDVAFKDLGVKLGNLPGGPALPESPLFHFVFTHIPVTGQVADIGDVHHMFNPVSVIL